MIRALEQLPAQIAARGITPLRLVRGADEAVGVTLGASDQAGQDQISPVLWIRWATIKPDTHGARRAEREGRQLVYWMTAVPAAVAMRPSREK